MDVPPLQAPPGGLFWLAPWVGLALALAFAFAPAPAGAPGRNWRDLLATEGFGWTLAIAGAISCLLALGFEPLRAWAVPAGVGFAGALAARVLEAIRAESRFSAAMPWALAAFVVGALQMHLVPGAWVAIGFGACAGALMLGAARPAGPSLAPVVFGLAVALTGAAGMMGALNIGGRGANAGIVMALTFAVAGGAGAAIRTFGPPKACWLARIAPAALALVLAWPLATRYFETPEVAGIVTLAVLAGALAAWALADAPRGQSLATLVGGILWVAVATIAFAYLRGFGMALAALSCVAILVFLDAPRAVLAAMPLLALAMFRVFRQANPELVRALDIGQHYALIGILAGALLVLAPLEWARAREAAPGVRSGLAAAAMALGLLMALVAAIVLLGAKGAAGLLVGFGMAGLIASLQGVRGLATAAAGLGLALATLLAFQPLAAAIDLARDERLIWLVRAGLLAAIPVAAALVIGGRARSQEARS
jgi:hypothetical protein